MFRARWIVVAAVLAAGCGGSSTPTSPGGSNNSGGVPPGGPPPNPGSHFVSGSVVSALDDSAAGSVSFTVNGTLVGRSEANGSFAVGFHAPEVNRTVLTANGFVTRETGIRAPGNGVNLSLIPSAFDLASFNQMFRHSAVSGGSQGLTRWKAPPALVIERRVLQFSDVNAPTYQALEATLTDAEVNSIIADMTNGYAILTAGRLGTFSSIQTQLTEPGGTVAVSQPGKIVVTRQAGLTSGPPGTGTGFWGYARWSTLPDGEVTRGFIILDRDFDSSTSPSLSRFHRSLRMHELGHTLGCQHVDLSRLSVMNSNARTEPNDFDRQAARLAMLRPTGNRPPDIDPAAHTATTATRTTQPVTWHGAH